MPDSIIREMLAAHTAATTTSYLTLGHGEESISTVRPHDQQRSVPTVADASANGQLEDWHRRGRRSAVTRLPRPVADKPTGGDPPSPVG